MAEQIKARVTSTAGERVAGMKVEAGDLINLSQRDFDSYSRTGQVERVKPVERKASRAKRGADERG